MAKAKAKIEVDVTEDDYTTGTYNVVRRDYFGDPGKNVGVGLSKANADKYAAERRAEGERCDYAVEAV